MTHYVMRMSSLIAATLLLVTADARNLPSRYAKWLNQDVVYIIDDQERSAFLRLTTDQDRSTFVKQFWLKRDLRPRLQRTSSKTSTTAGSSTRTSISRPLADPDGRRTVAACTSSTALRTRSNLTAPKVVGSTRPDLRLHLRNRSGSTGTSIASAKTLPSHSSTERARAIGLSHPEAPSSC